MPPLLDVVARDFRCLAAAELELHPEFTLITGPNASGKTSLLEAIACLGRGRSFRGAGVRDLVRHGQKDFVLRGRVERDGMRHRLAVQNGSGGLALRMDGDAVTSVAALAAMLPLQVIDPEVHQLVGGPPEERRRFLDWIGFHVEHGFLEAWRNFRRALRQRNAALKSGGDALASWDREFATQGEALDRARSDVVRRALPVLEEAAEALLGASVSFEYQRGWSAGMPLAEALAGTRERDLLQGSTGIGPQRADLRLRVDERMARRLVSRGQQKLLASAMVLGSVAVARTVLPAGPLLLLDDPAAELDEAGLGRLMQRVGALGSQVVATALTAGAVPCPTAMQRFHVEHGSVRAA
ncbi:MAG: DNA replication/repair protein RecF [Woeseiaceae bacterium]|nr:DNA replication/repair protein RecF [Woeseiaceae bacterium]